MNIFFGLNPEGITVFLWFRSDCSLFSQNELPWGFSRIWFVTSEPQHLEVCQASAFGWYTLFFNGNPPLPPHTHKASGRRHHFIWENYHDTGTHQLCLSSHSAMGCTGSTGHAADGWTQQNFPILLLTHGSALHPRFNEFIRACMPGAGEAASPTNHGTARCHCHQAFHVLGMVSQLNQGFQPVALWFIGLGSLKQMPPEGQLRKVIKHKLENECFFGHFMQSCQHSRNTRRATSPLPSVSGCTKWKNVKEDFGCRKHGLKYRRNWFPS